MTFPSSFLSFASNNHFYEFKKKGMYVELWLIQLIWLYCLILILVACEMEILEAAMIWRNKVCLISCWWISHSALRGHISLWSLVGNKVDHCVFDDIGESSLVTFHKWLYSFWLINLWFYLCRKSSFDLGDVDDSSCKSSCSEGSTRILLPLIWWFYSSLIFCFQKAQTVLTKFIK